MGTEPGAGVVGRSSKNWPSGKSADRSSAISDSFKRRADSSAFWEAWVGAVLARKNLYTVHHPFSLSDEIGVSLNYYASTWDLDVSPDNKVFTPVEVKSSNLTFTLPNDYPHLGVLVCSDASWRKKWGTSDAMGRHFLMVSRVNGSILWLPRDTETGVTMVTDKTRKETYACRTTHKTALRPLGQFVDFINQQGDPWK